MGGEEWSKSCNVWNGVTARSFYIHESIISLIGRELTPFQGWSGDFGIIPCKMNRHRNTNKIQLVCVCVWLGMLSSPQLGNWFIHHLVGVSICKTILVFVFILFSILHAMVWTLFWIFVMFLFIYYCSLMHMFVSVNYVKNNKRCN